MSDRWGKNRHKVMDMINEREDRKLIGNMLSRWNGTKQEQELRHIEAKQMERRGTGRKDVDRTNVNPINNFGN